MLTSAAIAFVALALAPTIEWHAPPECPDAAAFEQRVTALLGARDDLEASAVITVAPDPDGGFTAEVRCLTGGTASVRAVRGPVCASVADAAALVLAVQIDALAVGAAPPVRAVTRAVPPASPPPRSPTTRGGRAPATAPAPPAPRRRSRVRGALRLGGGVAVREVPAVAAAIELGVAMSIDRARVQLDATWVLDRGARLPAPDDGAGADIALIAAALRGGYAPGWRTLEFPLLAGVEVGDMTARGVGVARSRVRHGAWVAALVGAGLAWVPLRNVAVRLDPALVLGLARPRFGVDAADGVRTLYRPPVVGVRVALALEVRFP